MSTATAPAGESSGPELTMIDASKVKVNRAYADRKPAATDFRMIAVCEICKRPGSWIEMRHTKKGKRAVRWGLVDATAHQPSCDPTDLPGETMVAVADFNDENFRDFVGVPPVIDIPTRSEMEYQLTDGESLPIYSCDPSFG